MKTICGAMLLSVLAASGCANGFGFLGFDHKPPPPVAAPKPLPGPVTAEQVSPASAHHVANLLQEEMERE